MVKRYDIFSAQDCFEDANGEFVVYDDYAKLREAAKALLDTYCDETYKALEALVEGKV